MRISIELLPFETTAEESCKYNDLQVHSVATVL